MPILLIDHLAKRAIEALQLSDALVGEQINNSSLTECLVSDEAMVVIEDSKREPSEFFVVLWRAHRRG